MTIRWLFPLRDQLDLHTFSPREVEPLLEDYLAACREQGLFQVKIIHGKGTGQLKARVRRLLEKNPLVLHLADADADGGGWGATIVYLEKRLEKSEERIEKREDRDHENKHYDIS